MALSAEVPSGFVIFGWISGSFVFVGSSFVEQEHQTVSVQVLGVPGARQRAAPR